MAAKETAAGIHIKMYSGPVLPDTYLNYVKSKWLRSFRYGNDYMKLTDAAAYFCAYEAHISNILKRPKTKVRLAVLSDDPDVALGFSVTSEHVLHYVYVGLDYRRQGIGRSLVPKGIEEFTHLTKIGMTLWPKDLKNAVFQPFQ